MITKALYHIYKHTSPSGKSYVGQSKHSLSKRWKEHVATARANRDGCPAFHAALRKYDPSTHAWTSEILQHGIETKREADDAEKYWIERSGTLVNGYNCTRGGGASERAPDESRWKQRSVGLRLFVAIHGRWPSQASDDPLEKKVAWWVRSNKVAYSNGRLDEGRRAILEAITLPPDNASPHKALTWQWHGRDAQYKEGLKVITAWYASHPTRHPRRASPAKENDNPKNLEDRAFNFATNRRREKKLNELRPDRIAELERIKGWSWTGRATPPTTHAPPPEKYGMQLRVRGGARGMVLRSGKTVPVH